MITKLHLKNYRSYEDENIEFDKLTAIVGKNDHGKTNIFRGLLTVLMQKDLTEGDIRYGQKACEISIYFNDGRVITRKRDGKDQEIILLYPDGESRTYFKVNDLRETVEEFTGIKPLRIEGVKEQEYLQIFFSDDPQCWIFQGFSPASILQRVNRLMIGNKIESAKRSLDSQVRSCQKELAIKQKDLEQVEYKLELIPDSEFNIIINNFNDLQNIDTYIGITNSKILGVKTYLENLTALTQLIDKNKNSLSVIEKIIKDFSDVLHACDLNVNETQQTINLLERYAALNTHISNIENEISLINKKIKETKNICPTCQRPY